MKIETNIGIGWGESAALTHPIYGAENIADTKEAIRQQCSRLVGQSITAKDLATYTKAPNYFSFAAIEMALICAVVNSHGWPDEVLETAVTPGPVIGAGWTTESLTNIITSGVKRLKLKVTPSVNLASLSKVVTNNPGVRIDVDGNESFSPTDFEIAQNIMDTGIGTFEQPFAIEDFASARRLVKACALHQRICADEAATTLELTDAVLAAGAANAICIKPARNGGISEGLELAQHVKDSGTDVVVGGMLEAGLGRSFLALFNILCKAELIGDITPASHLYDAQPFSDLATNSDGLLKLPDSLQMLSPNEGLS